jgi:hypothetical protein
MDIEEWSTKKHGYSAEVFSKRAIPLGQGASLKMRGRRKGGRASEGAMLLLTRVLHGVNGNRWERSEWAKSNERSEKNARTPIAMRWH